MNKPIFPPIEAMTTAQLEARVRMHDSTAEMYDQMREPQMAGEFRQMADKYRTMLNTKENR